MQNQFKKVENLETDEMCKILDSDGVFLIENYLPDHYLKDLKADIMERCENGGRYEFGSFFRGGGLNEYSKNNIIRKVYDEFWMRDLYKNYTNLSTGYGKNIFATHDYKHDGALARNGWLHFDRNWCLKFFLYLTDIDKSSGAFSCSIGSRAKGFELRQAAWKATKEYNEVKNRIEIDYPELLEEYPVKPVEAKAGTLIVFDSDTFHKGGKVEPSNYRLIMRMHCG